MNTISLSFVKKRVIIVFADFHKNNRQRQKMNNIFNPSKIYMVPYQFQVTDAETTKKHAEDFFEIDHCLIKVKEDERGKRSVKIYMYLSPNETEAITYDYKNGCVGTSHKKNKKEKIESYISKNGEKLKLYFGATTTYIESKYGRDRHHTKVKDCLQPDISR